MEGIDEPVVYQGRISKDRRGRPVTVRKYSDLLLIFRAKKMCPEYRDSSKIELSGSIDLVGRLEAGRKRLAEGGGS